MSREYFSFSFHLSFSASSFNPSPVQVRMIPELNALDNRADVP
jgi:hypothetical protein